MIDIYVLIMEKLEKKMFCPIGSSVETKDISHFHPSYFWILQCVAYFMAVRLSQISDNATFLSSFVRRQILLNTIAEDPAIGK